MKENDVVIGIDLGSYYSSVSIYEIDSVKIIPNSEGSLSTPSIVSFTKDGIKVGEPAKRQAALNPQNTIFNIKRLIGRSYEQVKNLKRPYKIVNSEGRAAVEADGKIYSPEEISAMILQKMKKTAEDYLGHKVKKAVITVPAYFNSDERAATKVAGEIAGLEVLRVIAEPTSAILNVDSNLNKKYAVYDFGGQTLDVSIVDVGDGVFEILSTDGDLDLGGSVIDEIIVNYVSEEFEKEVGLDIRKDPMALQRLFEACEKAKIELSNTTQTEINLPYITAVDGIPKHLTKTLTRSKFEQLIDPIIDKTIKKAESSMLKSKLNYDEIDSIMLVGGSSRIPLVQQKLEKLFKKSPNKSLNPDLCVSMGASIQGHILNGGKTDILLLDVLGISVGLETLGSVFTKMIESDTTIPVTKSQVFSTAVDNQPSVSIIIGQGERPMMKDNKILGQFNLDNIPPAMRGIPQIDISFSINSNGILDVKAIDKGTGKEQSIRIDGSTSLSKEEIERMKNDAIMNEESDKKEKVKIDKLNNADSLIFQTEKQIKEFGDKLTDEDRENLNLVLLKLKESHKTQNLDDVEKYQSELNEVWNKISTKLYQQSSQETEKGKEYEGPKEQDVEDVQYEEIK